MGVINYFDARTTRQLSTMLLAANGGLLFSAFNMIAAGVASGNEQFAADVSGALSPLVSALIIGLISFVFGILADHSEVPEDGGRWSRRNFRETAFAFLAVMGLGSLVWATGALISAADVAPSQ